MLFRIIWSAIDLEYLDLSLIDTVGAIFCLDQTSGDLSPLFIPYMA